MALVATAGALFLAFFALSPIPAPLKAVLIAIALIALAIELAAGLAPVWRAIEFDDQGVALIGRREERYLLTRLGPVFVSPLFIGLRGRCRGSRAVTLGLFRAQISAEGFRALTIALRNRSDEQAIARPR